LGSRKTISILIRNPDLLFGKDPIHGIIIPDLSNIISSKEKDIGNHFAIGIGHGYPYYAMAIILSKMIVLCCMWG